MAEWVGRARAALAAGPTAMLSVIAAEGSAPRGAGTRMVVTADEAFGTIGGGALEHRAIAQARAILALPEGSWRVQDYPLGPLLGQCCGGRVRLLVERLSGGDAGWLAAIADGATLVSRFTEGAVLRSIAAAEPTTASARGPKPAPGDRLVERIGPAPRPLLLFGAGHVGRAVARAAAGLPFALGWFDSRGDVAASAGAVAESEAAMVACAGAAPADAAILILTHDHALDYRLTAAALRGDAAFVGLIGSATKRQRFLSRLAADGVDAARLTCPIGLPGIRGKEPPVIALSALAQLMSLRP